MPNAYIWLGLTLLTPYVFTIVAKAGGGFTPRANLDPRGYLADLSGLRYRADCAQKNSFEIMPAFCAAVLVAQHVGQAPQATIDLLAGGFLLTRLLYGACYLANWGGLRTLSWFAGAGTLVALFVLSA